MEKRNESLLNINIGLKCTSEYVVEDKHTAKHIGSGDVSVLSTPSMILFIEQTAMNCVQKYLPDENTTVGILVNIKHLNPVPVNEKITVEVVVTSIENRKIVFDTKVYWRNIVVGEGLHERYVVNTNRFIEKIKKLISENK